MKKKKQCPEGDVIIVGAGCCGLATALRIARTGVRVQVLEAQPESQWGRQKRNVIIDSHSAQYLLELGVEPHLLPPLKSMHIGRKGEPRLRLDFDTRALRCAQYSDDIDVWLERRDWASIVPLGDLQQALLALAASDPHIDIEFERAVLDVDYDGNHVRAATENRKWCGRFLIICDGGSSASLSRRMNLPRTVHRKNRMSFAVAALATGHPVRAHMGACGDSWYGLFSSGRTISCAVPAAAEQQSAERHLRELGYDGPLVEPPMVMPIAVTETTQLCLSERVVIAGDAAGSSDPRTGLGLQMALYWSHLLLRHLNIDTLTIDADAYRPASLRANRRRVECELALLDLADQGWGTGLFETARSALAFLGSVGMDARLELAQETRRNKLDLESQMTPGHALSVQIGRIEHTIERGWLNLRQRSDGLRLTLKKARVAQKLGETTIGCMRIRRLRADLQGDVARRLLELAPEHPVPVARVDLAIRGGETMRLGPMACRAAEACRVCVFVNSPKDTGLIIRFEEGRIALTNLAALAGDTRLRSAAWISALDDLTGQRIHPIIDRLGALASHQLREIRVVRHRDGTCTVTLKLPFELQLALTSEESARFYQDLASLETLCDAAMASAKGVSELRLASFAGQ